MDADTAPRLFKALQTRHAVLRSIRTFFEARDILEVDTPIRVPVPALEEHIDAEPCGEAFLRTSPELHMKRLLACGSGSIFQVGPCFRQGERGDLHHPEYTMLEWYRTNADYRDVLEDTRDLVAHVVGHVLGKSVLAFQGMEIDVAEPWANFSVAELFREHARWDPVESFDADRFDEDLVSRIEPALPQDRPVVLMDFPAERAALARIKDDNPRVAERWELYLGGLEMANAYSELTDAVEQRKRFEACAEVRQAAGRAVYPVDEPFLAALASGLPRCGGVALGVDRLVMLLCDAASLDEILPFRDS
jgi:lysyl-tRNA synthetase class 2